MTTRTKSTYISPMYLYYKQRHAEKEQRRKQALQRGEFAPYGYWKETKPINAIPFEPEIDDTPVTEYLKDYKLEITKSQANYLVDNGADRINLVIRLINSYRLTGKNALKLPNNHFIRDITGRWCLFRNKHFY